MNDGSVEVLPVLPAGTLLAGRYRIAELLGQGTMGMVYAVERLTDGRRFAAKLLAVKPDHQAMARFAREARLLARLQHTNLIALVDAEVTPDRVAYIIMELASGKSLAEHQGRYGDSNFLLPILYQVVAALAAVHAAGVVHRDLKPDNVLIAVSADGISSHAKLVDFGVSRIFGGSHNAAPLHASMAFHEPRRAAQTDATTLPLTPTQVPRRQRNSEELTLAGTLLGTLLYMAPELRGGAHLAHPPADIFSFGVMTYEVLTGTMPFDEIPLFGLHDTTLNFVPLDSLCPALPPQLARTFEACLAAAPADRPTAAALKDAFHQALMPDEAARRRFLGQGCL